MPNRTIAPAIRHAVDFNFVLPDIQSKTLGNGVPFYYYKGGVQEVVELCLVFDAGVWQQPKNGIATATGQLLRNGTQGKTAFEINDTFEFYGASLKVSVQNDYSMVIVHTLSKHLPALLPILNELLKDASFPEDEVTLYKKNALQRLQVQQMQCDFIANQKIDEGLFGAHHPYGVFTTAPVIENIHREDLLAFAESTYRKGSMKIFLSGLFQDDMLSLIEDCFGNTPRKASTQAIEHKIELTTQREQNIINDANGVQAAIRLGRHFPNRDHEDFTPMILLNTLYGGYFGSRLMANIREEKGYTYGIYSSLMPNLHGSALIIQSEVGRTVAEASIKEVYAEMDLLRNELIDEEELLLVKNYLLGNLLGELDGPFHIMHRWRTLLLNGFSKERFYRNLEIYKAATPQQMQALAQKYFQPKDFIEITVV